MLELLCYLAGIGTGILLALWTGHLARKRASREQRRIAGLAEAMTTAAMDVQDAVAHNWYFPTDSLNILEDRLIELRKLKTERNHATAAYYAALRGEP